MALDVGVIGAGFMGATHARAYAHVPGVRVAGIASRSADKAAALAAEVGARAYADALALLDDPSIGAVSIALPTLLHREVAVAALEAGKHVLVEKPMGLTLADCDAMIEAAARYGRLLMVAHVLRFWPEYLAVAGLLRSGALGKPLSATAFRLMGQGGAASWFADPEVSGGAVLDLHIHDLDGFNWLFGRPLTVYSRGQRGQGGAWDHVLTTVDYGEVQCVAEGSALRPHGYPFTMGLWVTGARGSVEFAFRAGGVQVDSRDAGESRITLFEPDLVPRDIPSPGGDGYLNEITYFVECVRSGHAPLDGSVEQGRLAVAMALAARRSLETGEVARL